MPAISRERHLLADWVQRPLPTPRNTMSRTSVGMPMTTKMAIIGSLQVCFFPKVETRVSLESPDSSQDYQADWQCPAHRRFGRLLAVQLVIWREPLATALLQWHDFSDWRCLLLLGKSVTTSIPPRWGPCRQRRWGVEGGLRLLSWFVRIMTLSYPILCLAQGSGKGSGEGLP